MRRWLSLAWVFARRDAAIARSYPLPFVLQLFASAGMLLVVHRVGQLVDPDRSDDPALQAGFFSYVLVGVVVLQLVTATVVSFAAKLREEQTTGTFEALLSTPAPPGLLVLCLATYQILRSLLASVILVIGGLVAGAHVDLTWRSTLAAAVTLLGLLAMAAATGVLVAAYLAVFKRGSAITGWLITILAFFVGVYFPVSELPGVLRPLAEALPPTWGLTALRSAVLLGEADVVRTLATLVSGLVLVTLALALFGRAVDVARRRGTLGTY